MMHNVWLKQDSCLKYKVKSNRSVDEMVSMVEKFDEDISYSTSDDCVYTRILTNMKVMTPTFLVLVHNYCSLSLPLGMHNLSLLPIMNRLKYVMVLKEAYRLKSIVQTVILVFYFSTGNFSYNDGELINSESTAHNPLYNLSGNFNGKNTHNDTKASIRDLFYNYPDSSVVTSNSWIMFYNKVADGDECVGICKFQHPIRSVCVTLIEQYVAKTGMNAQVACKYKYDEISVSLSSVTKLGEQGDNREDGWA